MHFIIAIFAFACAQAGPLILLVLGERWAMTVPIFRILVVGGMFQAAGYAAYWVFLSKGLTGAQLRYSIVSRTLVIGCIVIGSQWGVLGVAGGYACGLIASWPLVLWWLHRTSDAPVRGMLFGGLRAITGYGLCGFASHAASTQFAGASLSLQLVAGIAAMCAVFALMCLAWPAFRRDVAGILHTRTLLRSACAARRPPSATLEDSAMLRVEASATGPSPVNAPETDRTHDPARPGCFLVLSAHDYRTPRRANIHFIADELAKRGPTRFFSLRYSALSRWKRDIRLPLDARANRVERHGDVECFLWKTLLHPFNTRRRWLRPLERLMFRWYARHPPPPLKAWLREAEVVIFESGTAVVFVELARQLNPSARLIYRASDSRALSTAPTM